MPPRILLHLKEPKARLYAEESVLGAQESKVQLNLVVVLLRIFTA